MKHRLLIALACAVTSNFAFADSSVAHNDMSLVAPLTPEMIAAFTTPSPEGANTSVLCDSYGFIWHLTGFPKPILIGKNNICAVGHSEGTYSYWPAGNMAVTGEVPEGCYCNATHSMDVSWNSSLHLFQGTAYASDGCEESAPVLVGRCRRAGEE